VLDAAYEATLLCAYLEKQHGSGTGEVFLTFLGGGVFGNEPEWIANAIARAIHRWSVLDLQVQICYRGRVDPNLSKRIDHALRIL